MSETRSRFIIKDGQLFIEDGRAGSFETGILLIQINQQKARISDLEHQLNRALKGAPQPPTAEKSAFVSRMIDERDAAVKESLRLDSVAEELTERNGCQRESIVNLQRQMTNQAEYISALQRAIEHYCNGQVIPPDIASKCPHHADKLNSVKRPRDRGPMGAIYDRIVREQAFQDLKDKHERIAAAFRADVKRYMDERNELAQRNYNHLGTISELKRQLEEAKNTSGVHGSMLMQIRNQRNTIDAIREELMKHYGPTLRNDLAEQSTVAAGHGR